MLPPFLRYEVYITLKMNKNKLFACGELVRRGRRTLRICSEFVRCQGQIISAVSLKKLQLSVWTPSLREIKTAFAEQQKISISKANYCNQSVILDWGFWTHSERKETTDYFNDFDIEVEWHYVDVEQSRWKKLIEERNAKAQKGKGGSDFYVDEGLLNKLLSEFEEPSKDEIHVWHVNK